LNQTLALLRLSYFLAWASRNPFFCTRWLELTLVLLLWLQSTTSSSTGSGILPRTSASSEDGSTYCPLYFRFGVQLHLLALHECHFPLCLFPAGAWSFAKLVIWLSSLSLVPVSCLVSITVPASCLLAYPWTSALSLSREGGNFITSRVERLKNHPCRTRLTQSFLFKCFLKLEIAPRCPTSYPTLSC